MVYVTAVQWLAETIVRCRTALTSPRFHASRYQQEVTLLLFHAETVYTLRNTRFTLSKNNLVKIPPCLYLHRMFVNPRH